MSNIKNVLIVGGGIGGLSTAVALSKKNVKVDVAEINKEYNVYGVGLILPTNSIRAIHDLGLKDKLLEGGATWKKWSFYDEDGNFLVEPETRASGDIDYYGGTTRLHLHNILLEEALNQGVNIIMGTTLEEYVEVENGIEVRLSNGQSKVYDFVVGADGAYSKLRSRLFPEQKIKYGGQAVWRYPFKAPKSFDRGSMFLGKGKKAGIVPMGDGMMYLFLVTPEPDNSWKEPEQLANLLKNELESFGGLISQIKDQINDNSKVVYRPLETLLLDSPWHKEKILLIGDAAHATSPHLAQGAAISIEDSIVLAELVRRDLTVEEIFAQFMEIRFERCKSVVDTSDLLIEWELMLKQGKEIPNGQTIPGKMDEVTLELTKPILEYSSLK